MVLTRRPECPAPLFRQKDHCSQILPPDGASRPSPESWRVFLRHQLLTLLNADIAVFTQSRACCSHESSNPPLVPQNRASAVFIPDARIDWLLVGRNIVQVVCPVSVLDSGYDPEQIAANSCVLTEGDVRMVKIIHIVKSDASGTIGADQLGRLRFAPLKAGVCIRGAQVGQDAVICVAGSRSSEIGSSSSGT